MLLAVKYEYLSVFYLGFAPHHHTPLEMGRSCGKHRPGEGAREGNGGLSPTAVDRLRAGRPFAADKNNCLCACARSAQPLRFSRVARFISACPAVGSVPVIRPPSARARLRRSVPRLGRRTLAARCRDGSCLRCPFRRRRGHPLR